MDILLIGLAAGYAVCGALTYGITFAYFQRSWPSIAQYSYHEDRRFAVYLAFTGPLGLLLSFIQSGFAGHGLKWR